MYPEEDFKMKATFNWPHRVQMLPGVWRVIGTVPVTVEILDTRFREKDGEEEYLIDNPTVGGKHWTRKSQLELQEEER